MKRHGPTFAATTRLGFALAILVSTLGGCAAAFDGSVYHGDGFSFRVHSAPPAWRPMAATGAALAYDDPANRGQILVNARCDHDAEDVPLKSLTQHLFIRFTDRTTHSEAVVPFDGREALRTDITAKLDGVDRRFLVWVMKKDRCVYDLLYFAPADRFERGAPEFERWVADFKALPRPVRP